MTHKRTFRKIEVLDLEIFKQKLLSLSSNFDYFALLESNNYKDYPYSNFGSFVAVDSLASIKPIHQHTKKLSDFHDKHKDWMFGYFSYELKDEIENDLVSRHESEFDFGLLEFFIPKYLIKITDKKVELGTIDKNHHDEFIYLLSQINTVQYGDCPSSEFNLKERYSKDDYIEKINLLLEHIQQGDIYEINFCQEFYIENLSLLPTCVFWDLNEIAKPPFGAYFKSQHNHLLCSSPERFLKREKNKLISQPIKGTAKRGTTKKSDEQLIKDLINDPKERSENIMIVDLVRNDLSKIALKGSVEVEDLCKIYTFEQVHQMISTITAKVEEQLKIGDIINATFPMGSMTGAPKHRSMQLIEAYENRKRGLYSGAIGYITPKGNFDFNVVIRSIIYNSKKRYAAVQVGSAITIDSIPVKEYEECLIKAKAMFEALKVTGY